MSKVLSAADILAAKDMETVTVECPEWGGDVVVKSMTGTERDAFETSLTKKGKGGKPESDTANMRARMVAAAAVDDKGAQLFTAAQVADLGKKNAKVLDRLFDVASKLNGMFDGDVEAAKKD